MTEDELIEVKPEFASEVLQVNWIHNKTVEAWLRKMAVGRTLNVCCGMSRVGDVRIDIDVGTNRTEDGNLFNLTYPPLSFDTVICDPPFNYYNRFDWVKGLSLLAKKHLLLSVDRTIVRLPRRIWNVRLFAFQMQRSAHDSYLRLYYCWDRANEYLGSSAKESV